MSNASWATVGAFSLWDRAKKEFARRCEAASRALKWVRFDKACQEIAWHVESGIRAEARRKRDFYYVDGRISPPEAAWLWRLRRAVAPVRGFCFPGRVPAFD